MTSWKAVLSKLDALEVAPEDLPAFTGALEAIKTRKLQAALAPRLTPLLTAPDVAQALSVSDKTVYDWVKAGKIAKANLPGDAIRIPTSEVDRLLHTHQNDKLSLEHEGQRVASTPKKSRADAGADGGEGRSERNPPQPLGKRALSNQRQARRFVSTLGE